MTGRALLLARLTLAFLVFSASLAQANPLTSGDSAAEAAFYRGGGPRIDVELRIRQDKIVYGRIATSQFCIGPKGDHFRRRIVAYIGDYGGEYPPRDTTEIFADEIYVNRGGRFDARYRYTEIVYSNSIIFGTVTFSRIRGGFLEMDTGLFGGRKHADCRTDRYWTLGSGSRRTGILRFTARRSGNAPPRSFVD
jgi:hypothetical protein